MAPAAASAAASSCIYVYPFIRFLAGDVGSISTEAEAGVSQLALVAGSLLGGTVDAGTGVEVLVVVEAEAA